MKYQGIDNAIKAIDELNYHISQMVDNRTKAIRKKQHPILNGAVTSRLSQKDLIRQSVEFPEEPKSTKPVQKKYFTYTYMIESPEFMYTFNDKMKTIYAEIAEKHPNGYRVVGVSLQKIDENSYSPKNYIYITVEF